MLPIFSVLVVAVFILLLFYVTVFGYHVQTLWFYVTVFGYHVQTLLFYCSKNCIWLCNLSILSIPEESYSRNSCALDLICTFYSLVFAFVWCFVCSMLPVTIERPILAKLSLSVFSNLYFHCNFIPPFSFEFSCSRDSVVNRINKNPQKET